MIKKGGGREGHVMRGEGVLKMAIEVNVKGMEERDE